MSLPIVEPIPQSPPRPYDLLVSEAARDGPGKEAGKGSRNEAVPFGSARHDDTPPQGAPPPRYDREHDDPALRVPLGSTSPRSGRRENLRLSPDSTWRPASAQAAPRRKVPKVNTSITPEQARARRERFANANDLPFYTLSCDSKFAVLRWSSEKANGHYSGQVASQDKHPSLSSCLFLDMAQVMPTQ